MNPTQLKPGLERNADCWKTIGVRGDHSCGELATVMHCRNCPVYSAAGRQLLERDVEESYLVEATRGLARSQRQRPTDTQSVLLFRISQEWFALPARVVVEICERRVVHSIPHAPSRTVKGLVNIHGELLICVTLREMLDLPERSLTEKRQHFATERMVVLSREGTRVVFPVSEVFGLQRYHPSELRDVPATLTHAAARYTRSLLPWLEPRRLASDPEQPAVSVGLLDDELIFKTINRSFA